jgi:hypothetical protein
LDVEVKGTLVERGDKSTKFFHQVANLHRRNKLVDSLAVYGTMSFDSSEIKEHFVHFYKQLYFEQYNWCPKLDGLSFISIGAEERTWLERDFEESEVLGVVRVQW